MRARIGGPERSSGRWRLRVALALAASVGAVGAAGVSGACAFGIDVPALSACNDRDCDLASLDAEALPEADAVTPPSGDGARGCPEGRGPRMVRVVTEPAFCIDESEVTVDQYASFLAANERPAPALLAQACRSRADFTPKGAWPPSPGRGTSPVAFVDFCDAQAFCAWSGKALCGAREGGALDVALMARSPFDAWFVACGGDRTVYPYDGVYAARTCNGLDQGAEGPLPVMSLPGCRAGAGGALDMSGNLWEWTDTCERDVDVVTDRCFARGGAFNAPSGELTCASRRASTRGEADPTIGFRCCAP